MLHRISLTAAALFFVTLAQAADSDSVLAVKKVRTEGDIEVLKTHLQLYETLCGNIPSTAQGLAALVKKPEGEPQPRKWRKMMDELPVDPWGTPYQYTNPGTRNKTDGFDLFSAGPDKKPGTADDIGNW